MCISFEPVYSQKSTLPEEKYWVLSLLGPEAGDIPLVTVYNPTAGAVKY
jgi:hypothetical protein